MQHRNENRKSKASNMKHNTSVKKSVDDNAELSFQTPFQRPTSPLLLQRITSEVDCFHSMNRNVVYDTCMTHLKNRRDIPNAWDDDDDAKTVKRIVETKKESPGQDNNNKENYTPTMSDVDTYLQQWLTSMLTNVHDGYNPRPLKLSFVCTNAIVGSATKKTIISITYCVVSNKFETRIVAFNAEQEKTSTTDTNASHQVSLLNVLRQAIQIIAFASIHHPYRPYDPPRIMIRYPFNNLSKWDVDKLQTLGFRYNPKIDALCMSVGEVFCQHPLTAM
eukprot:3936006-Rhodomonas_salina.1